MPLLLQKFFSHPYYHLHVLYCIFFLDFDHLSGSVGFFTDGSYYDRNQTIVIGGGNAA